MEPLLIMLFVAVMFALAFRSVLGDAGSGFLSKIIFKLFRSAGSATISTVKGGFNKKPYNAEFAGFIDKRKIFQSSNNGLRLAKNKYLSLKDSFDHLLIIAPPGAGKTSCFVIPNVLESEMSLVVTDPSGEIFDKTSGHLQSREFNISVMDFGNPKRSLFFNPLLRVKGNPAKLKKLLTSLVHQVIKGGDTFWRDKPLEVLQILASALINYPDDQYINFKNLDYLLANFGTEGLDNFIVSHLNDQLLESKYLRLRKLNDRTLDGIISGAQPVLNYFNDDPVLTHIFSQDNLNVMNLRKGKSVLYMICPEKMMVNYSIALNLVYEEIFDDLMEMPGSSDLPIAIIMDEAGNQFINQFDSILTTCRKRNISVSMIVQDLSQLRTRYGQDRAETIWKSVSTHLIFPGLPHETCKNYSDALGTTTVKNAKGVETIRPLVTPDELRMLSGLIMISKDKKPVKLPSVPYFKEPELNSQASKSPVRTLMNSSLISPDLLKLS